MKLFYLSVNFVFIKKLNPLTYNILNNLLYFDLYSFFVNLFSEELKNIK